MSGAVASAVAGQLRLSADAPLALHEVDGLWRVRHGFVDLFAVQLRQGRPAGRRHFLLRLADGMPLAGLDLVLPDAAWTLLAVGSLGAQGVPVAPGGQAEAEALEQWIAACDEVFRDQGSRWGSAELAVPGPLTLIAGGSVAAQGQQVLWAIIREGRLLTAAGAPVDPGGPIAPVTAASPLQAEQDSRLRLATTQELLGQPALAAGLGGWHRTLLQRIATLVAARQAVLNAQLSQSAAESRRMLAGGLAQLGGFGSSDVEGVTGTNPDLQAIARVAAAIGQVPAALTGPPSALPPGPQRLDAMIDEVGLRARRVLLRDRWWRRDNGPLIGLRRADAAAVALLPLGGRRYLLWDPATKQETPVDEAVADELSATAWMLYRAMPDTAPGPFGLLRFSLTGGGRLGLRLVLASLVGAILGLGVPLATGVLVEAVIPASATDQIGMLAIGLAAAAFGTGAVGVVRAIMLLQLESRLDLNSQPALFDRLLRLHASFFKGFAAGDLADRAMGVQEMRRALTGNTLAALFAGLLSLVNLAVMLGCSAPLAAIGLLIAMVQAGAGGALALVQLRRERRLAERRGKAESFVLQCISGVSKLKVAAACDRAFALWAQLFGTQREAFLQVQRARVMQDVVLSVLLPLGTAVLFLVAAGLALHVPPPAPSLDGGLTPPVPPSGFGLGAWVAFSAAFGQLTTGLASVVHAATDMMGLMPLYERARPLLEARPETAQPREAPGLLTGGIEFSGVTFAYNSDSPPVLQELSFSIRPGEFVAIVGPSGCGKSTIMRLLLGFEEPQSGEILYDGRSLATLDNVALRRQVGVVLQNGRVQPGNLIENIGGGRPIPLEEGWHAARLAGMEADIKAMPMGMHTVLTDGGSTLSGGQRQRLMIARALARRPRILLLDEATSALDNKTQAIVTNAVAALGLTRIVIAHRLSTIEMVDRVLVLDRGRLIQSGSFEELASTPGLFRELARRQLT